MIRYFGVVRAARLLWAFIALLSAFLSLAPAAARPGTPNNVVLTNCADVVGPGSYLFWPPAICVYFDNTATEQVRFEFMFYENNRLTSPNEFVAYCFDKGRYGYDCTGALFFGEGVTDYTPGPGREPIRRNGFYLSTDRQCWLSAGEDGGCRALKFDTKYCLRVRTRDDSDTVSEIWSAPACVRTPPRPAKPTPPTVTVEASKRGDRIRVSWEGGGDIGSYDIEGKTSRPDVDFELIPPEIAKAMQNRRNSSGSFTLDIPWGVAADMEGEAYIYRACGMNISGRACSDWVSSLGDTPPKSFKKEALKERAGVGSVPTRPQINRNATTMPLSAETAASAATASSPARCKPGFVWREARPEDYVCVPPASRTRTAQENAQAASRRDPNGAYGPNTCINGYVWREAFDGDVVCVTPEVRATVREENRQSSSRTE